MKRAVADLQDGTERRRYVSVGSWLPVLRVMLDADLAQFEWCRFGRACRGRMEDVTSHRIF